MTTIILTIIGILLAAAAALMIVWYGGDAFDGGSEKAIANTALNNVQNVAFAIGLRNNATGVQMKAADDALNVKALVDEGYLASVPGNPVKGSSGVYRIVDLEGNNQERAHWVIMDLGTSETAREVCRTAERRLSGGDPSAQIDTQVRFGQWAPAHRRPSCINNYWSNSFMIYAPI
jgi:hypothetical protein